MTKKTKEQVKQEQKFSKQAFIYAAKDSKERLILQTLLYGDETYTKSEVTQKMKSWLSKPINKEVKA